jgi:hypothetical protein
MPGRRRRAIVADMFATFETTTPKGAALVETYTLLRLGDGRVTTLALWTATTDPMAYEVEADQTGGAGGRPPTAALTLWFDGPMSPARIAAARFGYRERIAPVLATLPGLVRSVVLRRNRDGASCVVGLAVDLSALESGEAAVNATPLLPGEDPALLTGPDRVETHHVVSSRLEALS